MKKFNLFNHYTKTIVVLATLVLIPFTNVLSKSEEYVKTYKQKYEVDKNATLAIRNKFGDVHCQVWGENSISIEVNVKVEASSQEKADKIFDKIDVSITGSRARVEGITALEGSSFNNVEFSIDYDIMMPKSINIDIDNKFGALYFDQVDGTSRINVEYGNLEGNTLNNSDNQVVLKFGEGNLKFMKGGLVKIEYSEWDAEGAENLDVYTRFSDFNITKLSGLKLDSQYDDIQVGSCGPVNSVSRFSDVKIDNIKGDFNIDTQYGGVDVGYIAAGFTNGKELNEFAGVNLGFDPKASFRVDAELKFGELDYPHDAASLTHQEENYTTNIYKGVVGIDKNTSSLLIIRSKNAGVELEYK